MASGVDVTPGSVVTPPVTVSIAVPAASLRSAANSLKMLLRSAKKNWGDPCILAGAIASCSRWLRDSCSLGWDCVITFAWVFETVVTLTLVAFLGSFTRYFPFKRSALLTSIIQATGWPATICDCLTASPCTTLFWGIFGEAKKDVAAITATRNTVREENKIRIFFLCSFLWL